MITLDAIVAAGGVLLRYLAWEAWLSTIVFGFVLAATAVLPRRYCRLRYLLWLLVPCRLLLPPGVATPVSLWSVVGVRAAPPVSAAAAVPAAAERPLGPARTTVGVAGGPTGVAAGALPAAAAVLWLTGVVLVGTVLSRRRRHFRGIVRRAEPVRDDALLRRLEHWRSVIGVRRPVRLLHSDEIVAPFTLGSLAPSVVLPGHLAGGGATTFVDCVLAHETAHIGRWDDLVLQFQTVVAALYFFHPLAWLAFRFTRQEADRACDQIAVARGRIPARTYGAALVASLSRDGRDGRLVPVPALAPSLRQVKVRLEVLVHSSLPVPGRASSFAAMVALGVVLQPAARPAERVAGTAGGFEQAAAAAVQARDGSGCLPADPLPGARVTSRFGAIQRLPNGELRRHRGVDWGAARGTPVHAAAPGVVVFAGGDFEGRSEMGRVVVVDHGSGITTVYAHLASIRTARGASVAAGAVVGTVGTTGYALGPHLHFEVRRAGRPVCPTGLAALLNGPGDARARNACRCRVTPDLPPG